MKTSTRSVSSLSALLLFGWSAATLAAATRFEDAPTKTVRFADLDLSTAVGAEALYERLRSAARIVCRELPHSAVRDCRDRAVDDAVDRLGSALLSSIHRSTVDRGDEVVRR